MAILSVRLLLFSIVPSEGQLQSDLGLKSMIDMYNSKIYQEDSCKENRV